MLGVSGRRSTCRSGAAVGAASWMTFGCGGACEVRATTVLEGETPEAGDSIECGAVDGDGR